VYDPVANEIYDESGSCISIAMVVDRVVYVANVGDSRVLFSASKGNDLFQLTKDHTLSDEYEETRMRVSKSPPLKRVPQLKKNDLRVTRCLGHVRSKLRHLEGNHHAILAEPDILSFNLEDDHDFLVLAS